MASGAHLSEEAGGVGGEFEVASSNRVTGETGEVSGGGEIGLASANLVAEDTRDVGGLFGVDRTNQVTREAGTVGGETADLVIEEAGDLGGETGVPGGLDGEIGVASLKPVARDQGGVVSEIGAASVNQIIRESEVTCGEIRTDSANHATVEAEDSSGEIALPSANHLAEEAGASSGETGVASANRVTGEAEASGVVLKAVTVEEDASCSEIQGVSYTQVNGELAGGGGEIGPPSENKVNEPGGESGKIGMASVNELNTEPECRGSEVGVASAIQMNGETGGESGEIGVASANLVNGEPVGMGDEVGVASAIHVNGGTGCPGGEASVNQLKPLGMGDEVGLASAVRVNDETGGPGGEICVASANQVNGEQVSMGDVVGLASAIQVNGEAGGAGGEIGVASANLVNGEPGGWSGEIGLASANQVNGEPLGMSGEIVLASANRVNEEPGGRCGEIGLASANQVNEEPGRGGGVIRAASANEVNRVSGRVGGQLLVGEKHRWVDTKVYRRRPKGEKNKGVLSDLTTTPASKTFIYNGNGSRNGKIIEVSPYESHQNHNINRVDRNGVVESEKIVSVPSSCGNVILKQIQPETIREVISNKLFSSAMMDSVTPVPVDPPLTNGAPRPPYSASDGKVLINLASTAKLELRELKRKFEGELYSVRKAVKKMDGGREEMVPEFFHPVVNSGVAPNGARSNSFATRVYSGTRSLSHVPYKPNIRPFNQLRVSVIENGHSMGDSIEREKRTPKANQFYRNSEFFLANDKFPPAESNTKSKSNGKKSSGGEFGFGVGSKVYKSCSTLLEKLMKHKHGWVFNAPVDTKGLGLHDYFLIIQNPMDLGTVKAKLIKYWYKSSMEFAEDVRLTFHNAMLYNPKGHDVHIMAETLLKLFEGKWPDIEVKYLRELRMAVEPDLGYPTPTSRITNLFQSSALPHLETRVFNRSESMPQPVNPKPRTLTPAPSFRTPALKKPKAKDVNKRDMTYDEKQKLSTNLQSLPPEKLDGVIQIIKKRSTALSQNDDEIEVDIDSVDTETLWELDRYVTNYKKSLSKNRRKAELANQIGAEARQAAEKITIPQPLPPIESTAGYGDATLSLPPHRNDPAANASGSSSSSSSSSSGSSSSDSDSDSSSEDSDGGNSPGT